MSSFLDNAFFESLFHVMVMSLGPLANRTLKSRVYTKRLTNGFTYTNNCHTVQEIKASIKN